MYESASILLAWVNPGSHHTFLQASVVKGSIRLADNGARLSERLAQLEDDISRQSELVKMYAEQLGPNTAPAMQDILHGAPACTNNTPLQNVVFRDQQRQPVSRSQHVQAPGHQPKQMPASAHGDALRQAAHHAKTRQSAQPVPASSSAPSSSRAGGRHGAIFRHARSCAGRRHQRDVDSHAARGQGRPVAAGSKPQQGIQSANARKGRQGPATDSRYVQIYSGVGCHAASES